MRTYFENHINTRDKSWTEKLVHKDAGKLETKEDWDQKAIVYLKKSGSRIEEKVFVHQKFSKKQRRDVRTICWCWDEGFDMFVQPSFKKIWKLVSPLCGVWSATQDCSHSCPLQVQVSPLCGVWKCDSRLQPFMPTAGAGFHRSTPSECSFRVFLCLLSSRMSLLDCAWQH